MDGEPHVLDQLACRQLDDEHPCDRHCLHQRLGREWPQADRAEQPRPQSAPPARGRSPCGQPGRRCRRRRSRSSALSRRSPAQRTSFASISRNFAWSSSLWRRVPRAAGRASGRHAGRARRRRSAPTASRAWRVAVVRHDRLHGLAEDAVGEQDHRRSVALGDLERSATSAIASPIDAGASTGTR